MKYTGKPIDLTRYYLYWEDSDRNYLFEYKAKNPENCDSRDNHNNFYFKRNLYSEDLHIGDFLATIIGKKIRFKVCDTELYKATLRKGSFDRGVLSYVSLAEDDYLITSERLINDYLKSKNKERVLSSVDIDTVIEAMFFYITKNNRPYQEFLDFKQEFINMLVFDAKFMISDRFLDDWFFRKNRTSGVVDLYPMFDNEMILGFDRKVEDLKSDSITAEFIEEIDSDHTLKIITPLDVIKGNNNADYHDVIRYLLKKYQEQTKKAIHDVKQFTIRNLEEELDKIEGVSPLRKELILKLFVKRESEIDKVYGDYNKDDKTKY